MNNQCYYSVCFLGEEKEMFKDKMKPVRHSLNLGNVFRAMVISLKFLLNIVRRANTCTVTGLETKHVRKIKV
jgi:hypothetical protein